MKNLLSSFALESIPNKSPFQTSIYRRDGLCCDTRDHALQPLDGPSNMRWAYVAAEEGGDGAWQAHATSPFTAAHMATAKGSCYASRIAGKGF